MNKYIKQSIAFTLVFLLPGINFVFGQEKLSLEEAIISGLENNFQVRISEENLKSAELANKWGTVGRYPSISIGLSSINRFDDSPIQQDKDFLYIQIKYLLL